MIKVQQSNQLAELTKAEAQNLTDRIRDSIDKTYELVLTAYERKAWKAIGYKTWEAYVQTEFDMSRRRSYQLLDQGRVIRAIEDAVGGNVNNCTQISEGVARELRDDLPAAVEQIKERAEKGEDPAKAAKEIAAAKRAEKEKAREERKAEQAEFDRQREENRAKLNPSIQAQEQAKAKVIAAKRQKAEEQLSPEDRIAELEEAARVLEAENAALKAENKKFAEMKAEFEKGGFEEVIRGKDEVIRGLETRLYRESEDKASWMKSAKYWQAEAIKLGYTNDTVIDIETGEVVNG